MASRNPAPPVDLPYGLEWQFAGMSTNPCWTVEPRVEVIETIVRQHLGQPSICRVVFFSQGALNKLYRVQCDGREYIMRVSLPVDPAYKTLSEVATLAFVRAYTNVPVARVIAFDSSTDNSLGLEWILMERMVGSPLADGWRQMSWAAKVGVVQHIAVAAAQLFRPRFAHLGNLYRAYDRPHEDGFTAAAVAKAGAKDCTDARTKFVIGRIVSIEECLRRPLACPTTSHGPFTSSQAWLTARLDRLRQASQHTLETSDDEDELDDARIINRTAERMLELLPQAFAPDNLRDPEEFVLTHLDLSGHNILVGPGGHLTAVVDWECVSVLPLWRSCELPAFLQGQERRIKPTQAKYGANLDGKVKSLFWEHQMEYEQTLLRSIFLHEMERIEPAWAKVYRAYRLPMDFDLAIELAADGLYLQVIQGWLESLTHGRPVKGLRELID
ncbi:MAG: hypothetical protein Q9163_006376 [Psora crenata]